MRHDTQNNAKLMLCLSIIVCNVNFHFCMEHYIKIHLSSVPLTPEIAVCREVLIKSEMKQLLDGRLHCTVKEWVLKEGTNIEAPWRLESFGTIVREIRWLWQLRPLDRYSSMSPYWLSGCAKTVYCRLASLWHLNRSVRGGR